MNLVARQVQKIEPPGTGTTRDGGRTWSRSDRHGRGPQGGQAKGQHDYPGERKQ